MSDPKKPMSEVTPADAQNTHQGRPSGIERGEPRRETRDEAKADEELQDKARVPKGGVGYES